MSKLNNTHTQPHTPGPWVTDEAVQHAMGGERIFKVIADRPYGGLIADVSAWWVDTQTAQANARLIAAAPELLEALKLAQAWMISVPNNDEDDTEHTRVVELVADTIAKAEGRG